MGLSASNLVGSSWIIAAAGAVAAVAVLFASRLGTLHAPPNPILFLQRFAGYILFACIQQFLLQDFFFLRLLQLLKRPGTAIFAAAAIFSLAHLPNPILTVLTFVWGLAASAWFLRYRSLYTLAVAHVILGTALAVSVPGPTVHNMRVGLGYLTYRPPHIHHHLNH
jgi:membrane protease YdiL (CAAX protease family)